jgi:hypothetical protein
MLEMGEKNKKGISHEGYWPSRKKRKKNTCGAQHVKFPHHSFFN